MRELKDKELMNVEGGANWLTAAFFNAAAVFSSSGAAIPATAVFFFVAFNIFIY